MGGELGQEFVEVASRGIVILIALAIAIGTVNLIGFIFPSTRDDDDPMTIRLPESKRSGDFDRKVGMWFRRVLGWKNDSQIEQRTGEGPATQRPPRKIKTARAIPQKSSRPESQKPPSMAGKQRESTESERSPRYRIRWTPWIIWVGVAVTFQAASLVPWLIFREQTNRVVDDVDAFLEAQGSLTYIPVTTVRPRLRELNNTAPIAAGAESSDKLSSDTGDVIEVDFAALQESISYGLPDDVEVTLPPDNVLSMKHALNDARGTVGDDAVMHPEELIPIINLISGVPRVIHLQDAARRVKDGSATEEDYRIVAEAMAARE